jgi:glycosyltransferase involved in cell wall biosynthesis
VNIYRGRKHVNNENILSIYNNPTFNSEKFILEAIQSVQNQTYENWELILVDDCSSDNTVAIILEMVEKMIEYIFQLEKNCGTGVARNKGISNAGGRYFF